MTTNGFTPQWETAIQPISNPFAATLQNSMRDFDFGLDTTIRSLNQSAKQAFTPIFDDVNDAMSHSLRVMQQHIIENTSKTIATSIAGEVGRAASSTVSLCQSNFAFSVSTAFALHMKSLPVPQVVAPWRETVSYDLTTRKPARECLRILNTLNPAVGEAYLGIFPSLDQNAHDKAAKACSSMRRVLECSCRAYMNDELKEDLIKYIDTVKRHDSRVYFNKKYGPNFYVRLRYIQKESKLPGLHDSEIERIMNFYEELCIMHKLEIILSHKELHNYLDTLEHIVSTVFVHWKPSNRINPSC